MSEIFAAVQLEEDNCITAAPKIQATVNAKQNKSSRESFFFTFYGFQPNSLP